MWLGDTLLRRCKCIILACLRVYCVVSIRTYTVHMFIGYTISARTYYNYVDVYVYLYMRIVSCICDAYVIN